MISPPAPPPPAGFLAFHILFSFSSYFVQSPFCFFICFSYFLSTIVIIFFIYLIFHIFLHSSMFFLLSHMLFTLILFIFFTLCLICFSHAFVYSPSIFFPFSVPPILFPISFSIQPYTSRLLISCLFVLNLLPFLTFFPIAVYRFSVIIYHSYIVYSVSRLSLPCHTTLESFPLSQSVFLPSSIP